MVANAELAEYFPGCVNQTSARISILRIQAVLDILSESFVHFSLSGYTRNDQTASADLLEFVEAGDLVVRDLGYFLTEVFQKFSAQGVFFISRLSPRCVVLEPDASQPFNLVKRLRKIHAMDQWVVMGKKTKLSVRLIAIPLPRKVAQERRRKARAKRDKRNQYSKEYYALLGWQILITNVPADTLSAQDISDIYGLRWQIEIIFKSWKSHLKFEHIPQNASAEQVKTLIYAKLIVAVLFHTFFWHLLQPYFSKEGKPPLSMLKVATLMHAFYGVLIAMLLARSSGEFVIQAFDRFGTYDKRKRINYIQRVQRLS